jgi:hypothetical protein
LIIQKPLEIALLDTLIEGIIFQALRGIYTGITKPFFVGPWISADVHLQIHSWHMVSRSKGLLQFSPLGYRHFISSKNARFFVVKVLHKYWVVCQHCGISIACEDMVDAAFMFVLLILMEHELSLMPASNSGLSRESQIHSIKDFFPKFYSLEVLSPRHVS